MAFTGQRFLLVTTVLIMFGRRSESSCGSYSVHCKTTDECVGIYNICDGNRHCSDGTDEEDALCSIWSLTRCGSYDHGFHCSGSCRSYDDFCKRQECTSGLHPNICKIVKSRTLAIEDPEMQLSRENVDLLATAVNTTLGQKSPGCPMLYDRVGHHCLSFFSLAKVSWPEARQFCKSIFGELASFKSVEEFVLITDYLKENLLTTDFWLGGRYDMDQHSWSWVNDGTPMPLGTPYWAPSRSSTCDARGSPCWRPLEASLDLALYSGCYAVDGRPVFRSHTSSTSVSNIKKCAFQYEKE